MAEVDHTVGRRSSSLLGGLRAMRSRAEGIGPLTLITRLVAWRLAALLGFRPVIVVHDRSRLRIVPARADHGIAKGVFLLRDRYEPSVRAVIDAALRPGDVALDIGANMGLWALRMAERVGPSGRVLAFEPGPMTLNRLRDNICLSGFPQIEVHGIALGAVDGTLTLHTPSDSGSASLGDQGGAAGTDRVAVRRLDAIWDAAGRPTVTLMKIDVEGAEPMVLAGAVQLFAACRPVVCCEINPLALGVLGFTPQNVFDFFGARDYAPMTWDSEHKTLVPLASEKSPDSVQGTIRDVVFQPGCPSATLQGGTA